MGLAYCGRIDWAYLGSSFILGAGKCSLQVWLVMCDLWVYKVEHGDE